MTRGCRPAASQQLPGYSETRMFSLRVRGVVGPFQRRESSWQRQQQADTSAGVMLVC
jgi:hypothetical protein